MASTTSMVSSTMSTASSTSSSSTAMPTHRGGDNHDDGGGGGRPLLFFVALGFGVVFTNLWIIVGVKYCFRYNQRARNGQIDADTGEPIDMANMRPHGRRRREKKLMTMDEVNERFPLTKYKIWRATREQEGLPTAGGVTAPPSRAASIKENMLDRTSTEGEASTFGGAQDHSTVDQTPQTTDAHDFAARNVQDQEKRPTSSQGPTSTDRAAETIPANQIPPTAQPTTIEPPKPAHTTSTQPASPETTDDNDNEPDDDDPITSAAATELLHSPGDSCAICIDTLDDEDEVRGLTCGHAFHAGCLDPWLTSRRACCPLCKADYYVPKPRTNANGESTENADNSTGVRHPGAVWMGPMRPGYGSLFAPRTPGQATRPGAWRGAGATMGTPWSSRWRNRRAGAAPQATTDTQPPAPGVEQPQTTQQPQQTRWTAFTSRFRTNRPAASQAPDQSTTSDTPASTDAQTTPGQLEAGTAGTTAAR